MSNVRHHSPNPLSTPPGAESDLLGELGRATTAYHEAPPDRLESARLEYERVLIRFKSYYSQGSDQDSD